MFSSNKQAPKAPAKPGKSGPPGLSFIGAEVVISGDITTSAQLHVDGRLARREALAAGELLVATPVLADRSEKKEEGGALFPQRDQPRIAVG